MKKSGFTLSEVLLTLGIIGVVAAMTVPSLMNSTEDKKLAAAAKKAYNTLQNAISQKQALTEMTPWDIGGTGQSASLIPFLAGHDGEKVQVLKYNKKSADGKVVQLPDGILMTSDDGACGAETGGTPCTVYVDINGDGGPKFHAIESGKKSGSGAELTKFTKETAGGPAAYSRTTRDIVHFQVNGMNAIPHPSSGTAQRYIQGIMNP